MRSAKRSFLDLCFVSLLRADELAQVIGGFGRLARGREDCPLVIAKHFQPRGDVLRMPQQLIGLGLVHF